VLTPGPPVGLARAVVAPRATDLAKAEVPFPAWGILLIVLVCGLSVVLLGYIIYKLVRKPKSYASLDS